jgi:hypothetical protein
MSRLEEALSRETLICSLARQRFEKEGTIEFDDQPRISEYDEPGNGAYVQAWVWVDFSGTPLSKEDE